jgi:hypothetical protein
VCWTFKDVFGTIKILETRAYFIPNASTRLFSPQVYYQEQQADSYLMTSTNTVLTTDDGCVLTLGYQLGSNMPMVLPPAVCALSRVNHSLLNMSFEDISSDSVACSFSLVDKKNQKNRHRRRNSWRIIGRSVTWMPSAYKRLCVNLMANRPSSLPSMPELDPASLHYARPVAWPRPRPKDPIQIKLSRTPRKYILWFVTISSLVTESLSINISRLSLAAWCTCMERKRKATN